jgi:tetratricopeptide (TPR) repeat protein
MFRSIRRAPVFVPVLSDSPYLVHTAPILGAGLLIFGLLIGAVTPGECAAQKATITEELRTLETYPFSEPNPIPILTRDRRLYPYHSFEGYSTTSQPQDWKVVRLENDLIEVFVLPEVGGKVWGAVVKATGHEFIYRNEVMKFRNISLRGPWTSGGIEMNFGVIGHTPATATPVDYMTRENPDGSVSCIVGSMDLPSRTHWRVEIRLPADKAYFETRVLWYNPTPLEQPYYNWMTAAAFAQDDLEMAMPGNQYLHHSGEVEAWPGDDEGRYLPLYRNNTFEGHKSYHVVGELHDFFGGYYLDDDYGFGHWSRHEEMPGQKLWLWALSREGGVWEDLLTDTDGQYVEFQAGRLFVQYSPGAHLNPITEARFDPFSASQWSESWFPVEGIGGLTEASQEGALHVDLEGGSLSVGVNAFSDLSDTLKIWSGDRLVHTGAVTFQALEPFNTQVEVEPGEDYRVHLPIMGLDYSSDPSERRLARPFATEAEAWALVPEVDRLVFQAGELMKGRRYKEAGALLKEVLKTEPWNREALLGVAELRYRSGNLEEGLGLVNQALQLDAYDARANFLAGTHYRALGRTADARDAFGWATRSTAFRSGAYAQLAEMQVESGDWSEATRYAWMALDYDRYNVRAWEALAVIGRKSGSPALATEALEALLALDPLHHFAKSEAFLTTPTPTSRRAFLNALGGEFPDQTLLELAIGYVRLGLKKDASSLLKTGSSAGFGDHLIHRAWRAWLERDPTLLPTGADPAFAFPYRPETLPILRWAADEGGGYLWSYLLALNLWAVDRDQEAALLMEPLGESLSSGPAIVARALLMEEALGESPTAELSRAAQTNPEERVLQIHLIRHLQKVEDFEGALEWTERAEGRFSGDFNLALLKAKSLINLGRPVEASEILAGTHVLPSESARESHRLWEDANLLAALDHLEKAEFQEAREYIQAALEWPESLGQGRPYQPEERLAHFLLGRAEAGLGNADAAKGAFQAVVAGSRGAGGPFQPLQLLAAPALKALGEAPQGEAPRPENMEDLSETLQGRMILRALSLTE